MTQLMLTRDGVYRSHRPMTDSDLLRAAPAALQVEAHESRSDQYQMIPTMAVVEALRKANGVEVFGATQQRSRKADRRNYSKHVLRLRRPEDSDNPEAPELVLFNAYDGSSSYRLHLGVFRFVCANGMVTGDKWDSARVIHKGTDAIADMVDETRRLSGKFGHIRQTVEHFKQIALEPREIEAFGQAAIQLRHDKDTERVQARSMTRARRHEDQASDLWTVFNRVQENTLRGGYWKERLDDRGHLIGHQRVRPVKGIDQNTALNKALWTLTEEMARLKR
jgi:hypothetical protein